MKALLSIFTEVLPDLLKKSDPAMALTAILWLATIGAIAFILAGCGTLNYEPLERTAVIIENTAPQKGNSADAKTSETLP